MSPPRISGADTTAATGSPLDAGETAPITAPARGPYTRFCAALSKLSLMLAVGWLLYVFRAGSVSPLVEI